MRIGIVSDHRGYKIKKKIVRYLQRKKHDVIDYGTDSMKIVDYPDYAIKIGEEYTKSSFDFGIAICANGVGMSIVCNKVNGVRCAKINNSKEAKSARNDDDINIISLPATLMMFEIKDIIDTFLKTPFSKVERYSKRIEKINKYEAQKWVLKL